MNFENLGFSNLLEFLNEQSWFIELKNTELDFLFSIKTASISIASLSVAYLAKIWHSYRFFMKRGLKSPEHEFFYGNFRHIHQNKNYSEVLRDWTKQYGKPYGYFEGHLPVIVTSDLDIIQEVFIKQSTNFSARKKSYLIRKENDAYIDLFESTKNRWKRMRMIMNPTFSSAKLRELGPILVNCADRLIDVLNKDGNDAEINVSEYFKRFTMDSIWNCAFGVDINMQYEKENLYFKKCEDIFLRTLDLSLAEYLGVFFHEFKELVLEYLIIIMTILAKFVDPKKLIPFIWLNEKVQEIVEIREKDPTVKRKDYIQLLIDSKLENNNFDIFETKKFLSSLEIKANLILFMLAGYETTSTALSYSTHVLATHPDEQIRLHDEICSAFANDLSLINSDSVQELEYLDWFVKEVLRFYPIGNSVVARRCTKKTTIKGIDIPVDTPIAVDVLSIHFDADLWGPHDPNEFYPPRHQIKRNPLAFMAFGNGPRNCIGMKFALIELKIALVKLIMNFEILPSKNYPEILELEEGVVRYIKNGEKVLIRKR
uniref:Cytochrome p450 3045C4 n=2 Tax=Brachionus TaxID=10194 RepID=W8RYT8_9BILA|nr:cytochrome p450 3045C4 [Brachionus koreanus]